MKRKSIVTVISILTFLAGGLVYLFFHGLGRAEESEPYTNPHGNYGVNQSVYGTPKCAKCHTGHTAFALGLLRQPTQRETCYTCHSVIGGDANVKAQFGEEVIGNSVYASTYGSFHPVPTERQFCTDCHNPHLSAAGTPRLLSVGEAAYSSGNKVCGVCHGSGSTVVGGDMVTLFTGTSHDTSLSNPPSGTQIKCVRCHQPHGSPFDALLRTGITDELGVTSTVYGNNNSVCFACHYSSTGGYYGKTIYNAVYHGTKTSSTVATVTYKGTTYNGTLCLNCHEPHGKTGITYYRRASGNTLCTTCHDDSSVVRPVSYSYRGVNTYTYSPHSAAETMPTSYIYNLGTSGSLAWQSYGLVNEAPTPSSSGTPATSSQKNYASTTNSVFWSTGLTTVEGVYNYQMYKFHVNPDVANIRQLKGKWIGYGEPTAGHPTDLLLWNKNSTAWEPLASGQLGDPDNPGTLSWSVSSGLQNYLDASNDLYVLARAMHDGSGPAITGVNITNGAGTSVIVNFTTNETATSYVYYGTSPGVYTNWVSEGTFGTSHAVAIGGLTNDLTYYYQIRAYDKLWNRTDYTDQFHTSYAPSTPTGLVSPAADPSPGNTVTVGLTWNPSVDLDPTDTISYEVEVFLNGGYYTSGTSSTNSFSVFLGYESGPVTVSWHVRAKDSHGVYSGWSATSSFPHTGPPPVFSCPNLYVWDGKKYAFVTDLAGSDVGKQVASKGKFAEIFPGLPEAIPWNMVQEKDGKYTIKIKSERDEVDFVDNVVLMAVDHPAGTRVALNDLVRGKQPSKIYTYRENVRPVKKATYVNNPTFSGGKPSQPVDVTDLVSQLDNRDAKGTYNDDNQFTFDLGDLNGAKQIKLVMVGWTEFANEVGMNAALEKRSKGIMRAKSLLEFLQPDGTWKKEGIQHFNGMTKTVVLDLTGKFPKGTKKYVVRLRGMIRPHIDFAGIDTSPQAKFIVQNPEILDATLAYRGVSTVSIKPMPSFDYYKLYGSLFLHEGKFTRYGDVMPLLIEVDDKLVVMDSGDELTLNFKALPPPAPGMIRSFILKPWVYYKESELAKAEPIPFRKMDMSKLPNSLGEYPVELKQYAAEWNTRAHHAGEYDKQSIFDQIKQFFTGLWNRLAGIWKAFIGRLTAVLPEGPANYKTAFATGTGETPKGKSKHHYSLNTDYMELDVRAVEPGVPLGYCGTCHAPHGKDDGTGNPIPKQLDLPQQSLCFGGGLGCHSEAKNSAWGIDLNNRFNSSTNATAHHSVNPTEQTANGTKLQCVNCHDPHLDTTTTKVIDPYNRTTPYNFTNGFLNYVGPGGEVYLMVKSRHDGRPPALTAGPTISNMTVTGCTVTWSTDEVTTGYVDYGPTSGYGSTATSISNPGTTHTAYLTGMVQGQNYHFRVRSYDPVGNYYFTADALVDTVAPTINAPGPLVTGAGTSTTITWSTDEASTSYVAYSPDSIYGVSGYVYLVGNDTLGTTHSVTLTGLTPGTYYDYQVRSADARGNSVSSANFVLRASVSPPPPELITLPDQLDGTTPVTVALNWNPSIDPQGYAVQYYAQISSNITFSGATSSGWISSTSWSVSINNWDDLTYYWRVMARNEYGAASVWSAVYSFLHRGPTTPPPPPSCPNLYVWNGKKYEFVTDIAGSDVGRQVASTGKYAEIFPGLPVAVPWNMLQEKDGKYTIKIKSERDEVDFVDNIGLTAVDHPTGTRVALNDLNRGKQPSKIYTYGENLRPVKKATYVNNPTFSGGKPSQPVDVTDLISQLDNREAKGTYNDDNQFTIDLGDLNEAKNIKLVMVGWTEFSDKEEYAAALKNRDRGIMRAKSLLEILQPDGTWKKQGITHFSGMTKTVVLDLTGKFPMGTKKYVVRLRGMLRPHINFVGIDTTPQAKFTTLNPEILDAALGYRGNSTDSKNPAPYFDYYKLSETVFHEGKFTKYGDVLPLLKEVDDRLVVMDSGDELTLNFKGLPPPAPGMTRSFILKPWVYYKEYELAKVEPIPFRKMDMYKLPNSLGEYPAELKATAAEWNTRVHHAGETPKPGVFDRIKEFFAGLVKSLAKLWHSIFSWKNAGISRPTQLVYKPKVPGWWLLPPAEKHYSLNTNYITLQVDNTVTTFVYDVYSAGSAIWDNNTDTEPTPSTPGIDASAHKAEVAADDSSRWRTDNYPTPNQDDGKYNYQMFKFALNSPTDKFYSFKVFWKGYGEPSPSYNTSLNVWNFVYSRWDQIDSRVIGVDTSFSIEKYIDFQPYCYKCHAGTVPPGVQPGPITRNISSSYSSDYHGGAAGPQSMTSGSIAPAYARGNAALPCADCHDTHGSKNAYHLRENLNGVTGKSVPNTDYANNANTLNFCRSCHAGTLYQFHQACLDCHRTVGAGHYGWAGGAPTADDFGQACINCHTHGGSVPAHGACHCWLGTAAKAF